MLVSLGKTATLSDLMLNIKRDSSKWMKEHGIDGFAWQDGYFAFSIGESGLDALRAYIAGQKEHHATVDFKDENRDFVGKAALVANGARQQALGLILEDKGIPFDPMRTSYFVGRNSFVSADKPLLPRWQQKLFLTLSRFAASAGDFFGLPANRVVELGSRIEI